MEIIYKRDNVIKNIRQRIKQNGFTTDKSFYEKIGMPPSTFSQNMKEGGEKESNFAIDNFIMVCNGLNTTPNELLGCELNNSKNIRVLLTSFLKYTVPISAVPPVNPHTYTGFSKFISEWDRQTRHMNTMGEKSEFINIFVDGIYSDFLFYNNSIYHIYEFFAELSDEKFSQYCNIVTEIEGNPIDSPVEPDGEYILRGIDGWNEFLKIFGENYSSEINKSKFCIDNKLNDAIDDFKYKKEVVKYLYKKQNDMLTKKREDYIASLKNEAETHPNFTGLNFSKELSSYERGTTYDFINDFFTEKFEGFNKKSYLNAPLLICVEALNIYFSKQEQAGQTDYCIF